MRARAKMRAFNGISIVFDREQGRKGLLLPRSSSSRCPLAVFVLPTLFLFLRGIFRPFAHSEPICEPSLREINCAPIYLSLLRITSLFPTCSRVHDCWMLRRSMHVRASLVTMNVSLRERATCEICLREDFPGWARQRFSRMQSAG